MPDEKVKEEKKAEQDSTMIRAEGLVKIYKTKETEVLALQGLDLEVQTGELTAMIGNSGSGKSTLVVWTDPVRASCG